MKLCPNCGFPLDGKTICTCGYNVETGEINKDVNDTDLNNTIFNKDNDSIKNDFNK